MGKKDWEKGFTQGYMCAVATLMRAHGEDTYCKELLGASGDTLEDCLKQGVDPHDLEVLIPLYRELEARNACARKR